MATASVSPGSSVPTTSRSGGDAMVASSAGYCGSVGATCVVRGSMVREGPEYSRRLRSRQCVEDDTLPDRRARVAAQEPARLGRGLAPGKLLHHPLPGGPGPRGVVEIH